jgi:hypothetical protein
MRIVAINAIFSGIVFVRIYTGQLGTLTGRIGQIGVAPETLGSAGVNYKGLGIIRMVNGRSVAVFTLNICMG